jgi:hypothetical protein
MKKYDMKHDLVFVGSAGHLNQYDVYETDTEQPEFSLSRRRFLATFHDRYLAAEYVKMKEQQAQKQA